MEMSPPVHREEKHRYRTLVHWEDNDMTVMSLDRIDIKILNELQQTRA
jgi:hypothetical protein